MSRSIKTNSTVMTRRQAIQGGAAWTAVAGICGAVVARAETEPPRPAVVRGNIRQSMAFWCFNVAGDQWDLEQQAHIAKRLGCQSVELLGPDAFDVLKRHGLVCAITSNGMPGAPFATGLNNPRYQDEVIARTREVIDANAAAGFPNVIAFTGYKWRDADDPSSGEISREEGADRCVAGLKRLAPHAEQKGVTICLEMLNTRDDTHPMKGHPGYQGDDIDYCAEIVKRVGSPRVKLLFDIYHVQVMNGDLVRRIRQYGELIGHIHTAGNPGRCELDEDQEINYPACMKALLEAGYQGYVGHEFIPTRDPWQGLVQAVSLCDV